MKRIAGIVIGKRVSGTLFAHFMALSYPGIKAARNGVIADNAMTATVTWLREFKSRCLGCCK
jgi:hypothetical protein